MCALRANNSVLDKYQEEIARAKLMLSHGKDPFQRWTITKITHLALIMEPREFYQLLVESSFIVTSHVKCGKCGEIGKMSLQKNPSKADGLVWACNNKISPDGKSYNKRPCNSTRSVRVNSWFYKSKLTMPEVIHASIVTSNKALYITYCCKQD